MSNTVVSSPAEVRVEAAEGRPVVLIVDDDPAITATLRSFFTLETPYEIHTFEDPLAALAALSRIRPDIVISDFLMGGMDGIKFLSRVRELDRDIPLILLTGYADKENAIRAINEIGLYHYVEKPWDNDNLKLVVHNGLKQQNLARQLRAKIRELDRVVTDLTSLQARDELLRGELEMARRIQESLLPSAPPKLPGLEVEFHYLPLIEIGGDFFDFQLNPEGRLDILVADVVGHGIQAALIAAMVKAVFRETTNGLTPAAALAHLNTRLGELLPVGRFVTAVAISIDVPHRRVQVANAGHPSPFWLSPKEDRLEELAGGSLPLAILGSAAVPAYADIELAPKPGDRLFVYTDGLADLTSPDGERFGDRELEQVLQGALHRANAGKGEMTGAQPLGERVLAHAKRFTAGEAPVDDINIVTLTFIG